MGKEVKAPSPAELLLSTIEQATQADLEAIKARGDELEKQLAGVRQAQKLVEVKLNGPTKRGPNKKKAEKAEEKAAIVQTSGNDAEKRKRILVYLRANGPKSKTKLSEVTGIAMHGPSSLGSLVNNHPWFHVDADGMVKTTSAGDSVVI